jgi:hypothetical protein
MSRWASRQEDGRNLTIRDASRGGVTINVEDGRYTLSHAIDDEQVETLIIFLQNRRFRTAPKEFVVEDCEIATVESREVIRTEDPQEAVSAYLGLLNRYVENYGHGIGAGQLMTAIDAGYGYTRIIDGHALALVIK